MNSDNYICSTTVHESFYENEEELELFYDDTLAESDVSEKDHQGRVSLNDGFVITRNTYGYLNLEYWADICGYTVEEIIHMANGKLIWRDLDQYKLGADRTVGWITREQVLRGNRIKKLQEACALNRKTGLFDEYVNLLKNNLPEEVCGEDIHINLGSTWVLSIDGFIADFVAELLKMTIPPKVTYDSYRGRWFLECKDEPNYVLNRSTYGTMDMSAARIIEHKLNARPIKVYEQIYNYVRGRNETILNKEKTLSAQEKGRKIDERFQDYCHGNRAHETLLQEAYTKQFGYGICSFDGDYLQLQDLPGEIKLYKHQKDAIAHILACRNVLLAHQVGAGKTFEYSCGIHELIRLGFAKKVIVTVPKGTLDSVYRAYVSLFPMDAVMLCSPSKEFAPANREQTLARIKEKERVVVFMAYSSFDMLTMTREYSFARKDQELQICRREIARASDFYQKMRLKTILKRMEKSVKAYKESFKDTETACFDELGIDALVVDEAHNYKNIPVDFNEDNIIGMRAKGSRKAVRMLEKVRYLQGKSGHVIFATGTPITNSMADLYILQYYLQPEQLKICNIYHFNDWINTFCAEEHNFEVDVDSKNGRFTTRFARYHNLPELMAMFSEVCDFYQGNSSEMGGPVFRGYKNIVVPKSHTQKEYIEDLAERTEAIRKHHVKRTEDNLLKITVEGRLIALDERLMKKEVSVPCEDNKVNVCTKTAYQLYDRYPNTCQLIFSDIGTPKDGFNIYDELRHELIKVGVQPDHIAFVHDAVTEKQRSKLEKDFNQGKIRILIGSTAKLGTGSNVQERLLAIHHLDVPWKPSDMVQREGRILRQGNACREVYIFRYVTECSFDAYTYQILENKQRFISQFLSGELSALHRSETDCADTVLNYAEIKALAIGNPLVKNRVEVSNQLEYARINQRQKKKELLDLEDLYKRLPHMIKKRKWLIINTESDIAYYEEHHNQVKKEERRSFGEELIALEGNILKERERLFSVYQGFSVILPPDMVHDKEYVILRRAGSNQYSVSMNGSKVMGCCQRLDYFLDHLNQVLEGHRKKLRSLMIQQKQAGQELEAGNIYDDEVNHLIEKLGIIDRMLKEGEVA